MWVRYIYRAHLPHWTFSPTCDTAYCNTPNNHLQQKYCTPFYFWCICDLNFNTWEAWQKESCSCLHKGFSNLRKDIWLLQTTGIHFKWIFFKVWYKAHLIICFCLRGEINAPKYRKQIQRNEQIQKQRNNLPAFSECGEFAEIKLWESSRLLWWMRVGKVVKRGGSVLALTQFWIAQMHILPQKNSTKKWPKNDLKLPKIAQKLPKIAQIGPKMTHCNEIWHTFGRPPSMKLFH